MAAQRRTLLPEQRRSVSLSSARPPDPAGQVADENLGAEQAAELTNLTPAEPSEATQSSSPSLKLLVTSLFVYVYGHLLVPLCRLNYASFSFFRRVIKRKDVVYLLAPLEATTYSFFSFSLEIVPLFGYTNTQGNDN